MCEFCRFGLLVLLGADLIWGVVTGVTFVCVSCGV